MRDIVLFDLDGTLVDSAHGIGAALNHLRIARRAAPLHVDIIRPLVALGAETLVERGLGEAARDRARDLAAFRDELRNVPADRAAIYPAVEKALAALALAGCRMAIVTNKPEALARQLLVQLDLSRYFPVIVGGDSAPRCKPHPDPVRLALRLLGGGEDRCVFVGDSGIDAAVAHVCTMPFLLFEGGYGSAECDPSAVHARFASFDDLPPLILHGDGKG